ncbi:sulfur oxidation c-type cytochrome SoxX [Reinekea forsetii]|uniref:sulfur oxidation c-type cytochrome SoxX n=1 Tax=Reinekea forsetii TaxID=1336806 RepID=UPI002356805A|nr:sulfur oxidation c-type cytochrome SoxX [Reinekea forsetii]MDO7641812.1 sulfur oxidation c-type cytochrome SoxX [Reinekea forsetii]
MKVRHLAIPLLAFLMSAPTWAGTVEVEKGKDVVYTRTKGNCISCHMMPGGNLPGNYGPPLVQMQARFPKQEDLFNQIYDARVKNPLTIMPPFGAHRMLSEDEINWLVEYLYTL